MKKNINYTIGKPYKVIAKHPSHSSYNRMHKDDLPKKLGFRGAFVLGVSTFGNMTRSLVNNLGEGWLNNTIIEAKFIKPICDGDVLRIETLQTNVGGNGDTYEVTAYNESANNEISARIVTSVPAVFPEIDPTANLQPNEWIGPVTQKRTFENIVIGEAYRSLKLLLTSQDNLYWKSVLGDDLTIYTDGEFPPIHPAQVLRLVQLGYNNQFIGDNAVHSSSKAVIRKILRVGDSVNILTVPLEKWDKKENHWLTIYCAVSRNGEVCAEIYHTQIIKLRGI